LKGNDGWSLRDVFFTPGLILSGQVKTLFSKLVGIVTS
jgi:hypothetical protein